MTCLKRFATSALCSLLLIGSPASADGLDAQIQSTTVAERAPFQLVLSGDTGDLTAGPDLTPLENDFDILGTSQSRQTQIVNGARSDTINWTVTLAPKSKGMHTIPKIHAGNATSEALSIEVVDAANLPVVRVPGAPELSISVPEGTHYVHQEIPVTLRVVSGANLQRGELSLPQSPDFTLTQSGEDRTSQAAGANGPVRVLERTYMLRPQKDGEITLPPITLNAVISDPNARSPFSGSPFQDMFRRGGNDLFADMFNSGKQVAVHSAPVKLSVKANPAGTDTWFLPAKGVQIKAKWSPENAVFKTGEAVERTIQVIALGATGTQLPDLEIPQAEGLRIYLDGTQNRTVDTPEGSAALREFSYSVVPTAGGQVTFPEVQVQWFDTASETEQTATLPAQTITVEGIAPVKSTESVSTAAQAAKVPTQTAATNHPWKIVTVALLIAGLVGLIIGRIYTRRRGESTTPTSAGLRTTAMRKARAALRNKDMIALHAAGREWMLAAGVNSDVELAETVPALVEPWATFESMLFGKDSSTDPEKGAAALRALEQANQALSSSQTGADRSGDALKPLYRIGPGIQGSQAI